METMSASTTTLALNLLNLLFMAYPPLWCRRLLVGVRIDDDALWRLLGVIVDVILERAVAEAAFKIVLLHLGVGLIGRPLIVGDAVDGGHRAGAVAASVTVNEDRLIG